jgi:hypothetical protein
MWLRELSMRGSHHFSALANPLVYFSMRPLNFVACRINFALMSISQKVVSLFWLSEATPVFGMIATVNILYAH